MAKLNPDTHVLLDGAAKVYLRSNTKRWQATFQIEGQWISVLNIQMRNPSRRSLYRSTSQNHLIKANTKYLRCC